MNIPSFMLNQDLASLLITLAGQSIIVSLIGIAAIRLLSIKSAPVRSLACTATIAALGFLLVISIGFRLAGISWHQSHLPVFLEETTSEPILSPKLDKSLSSPLHFESISLSSQIQSQPSNEKSMAPSTPSPSSFSIQLSPPISLFINGLGVIWLMGLMFQLVRLGHSFVLVKKFRNSLSGVHGTFLNDMVRNVAGQFWNNRLPELYSSPLIESPITIGLINPIVVIPRKLFDTLSENELKSILLHELSHIYHYDQVIGVIKSVVMALHWWSPLVYKINRYHEQAREEVSDNYVLREIDPRIYTRCLVDLAEKVCLISSLPTAVGMAGRRFDLRVRVEQLLSQERRVVMDTRVYLKAITFSICLFLTFIIAGLHARVKAEAVGDPAKELQVTRSAINSASIFEEAQPLSQKNITEPEAIEGPAQDNLQVASYVVAMLQAESSKKQDQETVSPIIVLASADTKVKEKAEKQAASGTDHSTILKEEAEDNTVLSQKETIVKDAPNADEYISRGVSNLKKGQLDNAVSDFNKAIDLDPRKAFESLGPLAEENHAAAQFLLGSLYINGQGVEKDDTKGLSWIMKAAHQGYDEARLLAFSIYLELSGWGDARAMYNLGYMYLHGWGGKQDTDVGIGWLESAAKNGHVRSAEVLSGIYAEGKFGITPDENKASFWSNLPAESAASIDGTGSREAPVQGGPPTGYTFDSDAREYILEEITVIGQNSIGRLFNQVDSAVDRMYEIYNELNTDDDFDIRCRWYAPTGSLIRRKICTPVYVNNLLAKATQYGLYDMNNSGITSIYIDYTEMAITDAKLRENMKRLILENPSLFDAVVEHVKLREELKRQRQIYWGLEED